MDDAGSDTAENLLERGRALLAHAEELSRIAAIIREEARKLTAQAEKTARILAATRRGKVE